ncbi:arsenical pump-driving ATPase [Pseudaquabacterium rugosum]|uniref:Arsenical pump-driving ATPase n=1 Tax=Pseudaquabacterium rugosum TaxID=2984194 RepID=A0ABU9BE72_9BURK
MSLPPLHTRHLFFTGKGGVGKTSLACASALRLARDGRRVLLVSTDPASNLDEVLQTPLGRTPTPVHDVPGLLALNIDPEASAADWRERAVAPYRGVLPAAALRSIEEQFSGACTVEIAAFDAFAALLAGRTPLPEIDHIVFDTAPTGHTLRLLALPMAWSGHLSTSTAGVSCLGPLSGLEQQQATYADAVRTLCDAGQTTVVLVARPERAALREADRSAQELAALGVRHQHLALNGVFEAHGDDAVALAMAARQAEALRGMPPALAALPRSAVAFRPCGLTGLAALRALIDDRAAPDAADAHAAITPCPPDGLRSLIDDIAAAGHGLVMTMGKGGVGKTTVAAAVAVALARRGHRVLLSTTDPAAHLAWTLEADALPGLTLARIDPAAEVEAYRAQVLAEAGAPLDAAGRALLEEDLRSPCTEEIAIFRAFARTVDAGREGFVVLDTAPTGHSLLLLDAAEAYHREVSRTQSGRLPEHVRALLPRLRDAAWTRVLIVTLAEATPVHEAERLQDDLRRAGIEPWAWVINQSLLASGTRDAVLRQRAAAEVPFIDPVRRVAARRSALLAWQVRAPVGVAALAALAESSGAAAPD